jgi:ABC-type phosphate/phosphonate transport system substrate-binding protein
VIATLPMYDLPELAWATDALWAAMRDALRAAGVEAPDDRSVEDDYHAAWHRDDLVLSQSCGWPLVTELDGAVEVIGAFAYDVPSADGPRYRSLLVTRPELAGEGVAGLATRRAAVNHADSLSGWVSLLRAVGASGAAWPGTAMRVVGAHVASLAAVAAGEADVAAIDAVTWALLGDVRPGARAGLLPVGEGPVIPCVPLIARRGAPVAAYHAALAAAVADPATAPARRALRIDAFHPVGWEAYDAVRALGPA